MGKEQNAAVGRKERHLPPTTTLSSELLSITPSFSILSDDKSKASSKKTPPHRAIWSFLLQKTVSSPVLKVIQ
jgi:hypothetical protein